MSKNNLKSLSIKGYKSIKNQTVDFNDINIIIGANGSGKSNLISIFDFCHSLVDEKLYKFGPPSNIFHFGTKITKQMELNIEIGNNSYHGIFIENIFENKILVDQEYCKICTSSRTYDLDDNGDESGLALVNPEDYTVQGWTVDYMNRCKVYHFHDTSESANFKKPQDIEEKYFLKKDGGNIAPFLYHLKQNNIDSYRSIIHAIQAVCPYFHDFSLEPNIEVFGDDNITLRWKHKEQDDSTFSAQLLSDGTARFILMATLFLQPKPPKTIVIDEPELGLHPKALAVLSDIIKSVSQETQIICSTQSVELANFFEPEDFIVVEQKDGVSTFSKPERKDLEVWLEEYGMGDIWCKNIIGGRP